jgi:hypothetical protein
MNNYYVKATVTEDLYEFVSDDGKRTRGKPNKTGNARARPWNGVVRAADENEAKYTLSCLFDDVKVNSIKFQG